MTITANQVVYWLKKAFRLFKKAKKQYDQHQTSQGQQSGGQPQQGSGAWGQQQQQQASPYPPAHQQQQGAWNQGHGTSQAGGYGGKVSGGYGGNVSAGGYGAHDGPATNQDMANAQNAHYVELRNQAIREGDLMAKAFSSSKQAYASGNGEAAHNLSMEGKHHQRNKDQYNAEAAEWIYRENNRTQSPGSIDLHGLYVQEAVDYTEKAIQQARSQGMQELKVIVGKGNHSPSHVAKIKPAITQLMEKERLSAHLDPNNGGVLVVLLQGQGGGRAGGQFVREMEQSSGNDCVVM